jgi:hypothetical protein
MNCCATVLLRYYGNAMGCIGHVTKENPICHSMFTYICNFIHTLSLFSACLPTGILAVANHFDLLKTELV